MKTTIVLFALLFSATAFSQNISPSNWNDYTGSHYRTQPWGGWVRDYKRNTGTYIIDSGLVANQIDTNLINNLFDSMMVLPVNYDAMLQTNGLGSARDTQKVNHYLAMIEADSGYMWREVCRLEAKKLTGLPNGENRIFWQVGNEISSPAYSKQLHLWDGSPVPCGGTGCWFDQFVIPIYVEYYLAPSVEGINAASMQLYGSPDSINICLGSLTNAGGGGASVWLDSLMNYTIVGTYAPGMAGKKVYELVDIITIHYMMGTASTSTWKSKIDGYRNKWFGVGKVKGIWSTEEVGIGAATGGIGAVVGALTTSRYLEWAITNNYTPYQCRTNYYANGSGPANTRVNDLNEEIFNFMDSVRISLVDSNNIFYDNPNIESHAFLSEDSLKGLIYTFQKKSNTNYIGSVSEIKIASNVMGNITGATCHYFSSAGHQIIIPTLTASLDTFILNLGTPVVLDSTKRVLITLIQTQPLVVASVYETSSSGRNDFMIYPNPASNTLHIQLSNSQTAQLKIINVLGEELLSKQIYNGENTMDVSELSNGIYVVTIISSGSVSVKKFIIQK